MLLKTIKIHLNGKIMDYEKTYKEALERVRECLKDGTITNVAIGYIEEIFPELKESKDERIRKELIDYFTEGREFLSLCSFGGDEIIAWLEKQESLTTDEEKQGKEDVLWCIKQAKKYAKDENEMGTCWFAEQWLEKQGNKPQGKALEAIHEQKPADKVEPKFNVGDWICNSACIVHIASIKNGMYYFDEGDGLDITFVDNNYHLWTIADAKCGDVLSNEKIIVIFKHFEDQSYRQHIVAYIGLDRSGDIQITDDTWRLGIDKAKPATKEQRELLFQKMHEAGYMWDSNSKQLLSLKAEPSGKQKPTEWGKEDERIYRGLHNLIYSTPYCDSRKELSDWLESIRNRIIPQPKEWSEKDNKLIDDIVYTLRYWIGIGQQVEYYKMLINKLQSLKQKKNWKPSEEQMEALESATENCAYSEYQDCLKELIVQLKKL